MIVEDFGYCVLTCYGITVHVVEKINIAENCHSDVGASRRDGRYLCGGCIAIWYIGAHGTITYTHVCAEAQAGFSSGLVGRHDCLGIHWHRISFLTLYEEYRLCYKKPIALKNACLRTAA